MKPILGIARAIRDFALPPRCPGCGVVVEGDHRFCLDCWGKLDFLSDDGCSSCGASLPTHMFGNLQCGRCLATPPRYDGVRAAVAYGETARRLVLKLKYGRRPHWPKPWRVTFSTMSKWMMGDYWCRCRCIAGDYGRGAITSLC